ncbi:MAG: ATP-binding protein [Bacteroidetes bacterium]|nr:ATP-binding protein [Bacteroidota bacterium]
MKNTIKTLLFEWQNKHLPTAIKREINLNKYLNNKVRKVIAVTGFRRVGKTFLLLDLANSLLKKHSKEEVIYLNFEDERIDPDTKFLTELLPVIKELYGRAPKYLLLDEIQIIPGWSKWVRRIHDSTEIEIIVTGSNSKMSSSEIPTELRGRFIELHVRPLSFKEFLIFKKIKFVLKELEFNENVRVKINNLLQEYLHFGGLPEVVLTDESRKTDIVQSYYKTVVGRDIAEHYNIRNDQLLRSLLRLLLNQRTFTLSKLTNTLKSMQIAASKHTIALYMEYIKNSYFSEYLSCFSYKVKDENKHPRKVYCVDNSFNKILSLRLTVDNGFYFENAVAHSLLSKYSEIAYWKSQKNDYEVDFVVKDNNKVIKLIQVCYDINESKTFEREIRALINASKELKCDNLILITPEINKTEKIKWFDHTAQIKFVSLLQFLLLE